MKNKIGLHGILILALPFFIGLLLAALIPSLVKAQSQLVFDGVRRASAGYITAPLVDEPVAFIEPNTIHATNGFTVHHVSKIGDGSNPTLGFSTAYTQVQDALGVAQSGDEIWVAQGVYTPGEKVTDSFKLVPGVSMYGGFAITDTQNSDCDLDTNVTVLSGDIDGNDITDGNGVVTDTNTISGTNSYHVVRADGSTGTPITGQTSLECFTITAGNAAKNGLTSELHNYGGGFYCDADGSGAICSPTLSYLEFSGNSANQAGGAMYNHAINSGVSIPNMAYVTFFGNSAANGGAVKNFGSVNGIASPTFSNVSFISNNAEFVGGGLYNEGSYSGASSPALSQVMFLGNSAGVWGGGMYNLGFGSSGESSPKLTNVLFSGNFSDQLGGAIYNQADSNGISSPELIHVTISGNWADDPGGAMYNEGVRGGTSAPQVMNSLLWDNRDPVGLTGIKNLTATVTLSNSLIQNSGASGSGWILDASLIDGGGNIDQDPLFVSPVDPVNAPTTGGNLRLASGSPAVDKGNNDYSLIIPSDLDEENRKQDGDGDGIANADMGAYEAPTHYKLQVSTSGSGSGVVTSTPAWINCGIVCDVTLPDGTQITLTAIADTGSQFDNWSGACTEDGECTLTMDSPKIVTAEFSLTQHELTVSLIGDGSGVVTSQPAGIDCGGDCSEIYDYNQKVTLTAKAEDGSAFDGWDGVCTGTGICEVTMTEARSVSAEFTADEYNVYLPLEFR